MEQPDLHILKPCPACGETMIFGNPAPKGDIEQASATFSRVRCPSCGHGGPVAQGYRTARDRWNAARALPSVQAAAASWAPVDQLPWSP